MSLEDDAIATPPAARPLATPLHTLDGQVTSIRITKGGTGYTTPVTITITGGGGSGATATALIANGTVAEIIMRNGGASYDTVPSVAISGGGGTGATAVASIGGPPTRWRSNAASWMPWPNRPFNQVMELATVPYTSPFHLTQRHSTAAGSVSPKFLHLPGYFEDATPPAPWNAVTGRTAPAAPGFLDFVGIPSRFVGLYTTVPSTAANAPALAALGFNHHPGSQVSHYREPGRINVNTISDSSAWRAMFGAVDALGTISIGGRTDPDVNQAAPPPNLDRLPRWSENLFGPTQPAAMSLRSFFDNMPAPPPASAPKDQPPMRPNPPRTGGFRDDHANTADAHRNTDRNVHFRYRTMSDLAERTTSRSNVFAVWVTVGYFDSAGTEVGRSRGFYIFDRSIPVAYERGHNHNVRDAILLRRILQ